MVHQDDISSFEELLQKDASVTTHHRNLQFLATVMYKVMKGIGPAFMEEIFAKKPKRTHDNACANTRLKSTFYSTANPKKVNSGMETLRCLDPNVWDTIPIKLRPVVDTLPLFKMKIKNWIPTICPCREVYSKSRLFIGFHIDEY